MRYSKGFDLHCYFCYVYQEGENMGMFANHFDGGSNVHDGVKDKNVANISSVLPGTNGDMITKINELNNTKASADSKEHQDHQMYNNQVYISLQSPSREDNPITSFVKPPDFISLKPLTQDEEKAILMQVERY